MNVITPALGRDAAMDLWLAEAVQTAEHDQPGIVPAASARVCDLQSMRYGDWHGDADIYPASVIKVPIMAEVYHRYAMGDLTADDEVVISGENQTPTSGPAPFVPGYRAPLSELVELMIVHSDNVATNQLIDVLRRERVTQYMRDLGLPTCLLGRKLSGAEPLIDDPEMIGRNRLVPAEAARLLVLVAENLVPGAIEQRCILERCADTDKLVLGLGIGDVFMHKTGETSEVSHDAGILVTAGGKRYVVVLYCKVTPTPDRADAAHANPYMACWMRTLRAHL